MSEADHQYEAAARVILGLLQLQTEQPGAIPMADLPKMILMAADARQMNGDFGAARLLSDWAHQLTKPLGEWGD
ncbi:hypothetical protein [Paracoccus sulfuroxidans]|uniref:Uncharacterized protein n=1 Tax=Paracoccus sulfuroxidans TaxID=384678 RepID=A0A562N4D7_9RHOB|nr:hypothetical protein [Paracoccus sulfuroxidans]AZV00323.1 hypothetical protein psul1_p15 [Paracoccus phage vB_PsuS_Psul1]TWI26948.1 hypothetical protein IQ24_04005 [Paracoccus sulfuroxidans]